jgi:hypothetical protein
LEEAVVTRTVHPRPPIPSPSRAATRRRKLVLLLRAVLRAGGDPRALLARARTTTYAQAHDGRHEGADGPTMLTACAVESLRGYLLAHGPHAAADAVREARETEVAS